MNSDTLDDELYEYEDENEEYELDLFKLVSTDSNDLNQYLVFSGSNLEWYAMNVAKIEEVIVFNKELDIATNNDASNVVCGTADIRGMMTTLIYFDDWYGNKRLDDSEYELIILANYGGHKLGIIVKEVSTINIIESKNMTENSTNNFKSTFIAKVTIETEERICTIYDGDQMLLDVFNTVKNDAKYNFNPLDIKEIEGKVVYFADDSRFVRNLLEELFKSLSLAYKVFSDGLELINYLESHPNEKVDLFITDLEMPHMGGREVICNIREYPIYNDIPILVHTNMSNEAMEIELIEAGGQKIVSKMNTVNLGNIIIEELIN